METSCCFWTSSLNVNYLRWTVEIEENNSRNLFFLYENCKKKITDLFSTFIWNTWVHIFAIQVPNCSVITAVLFFFLLFRHMRVFLFCTILVSTKHHQRGSPSKHLILTHTHPSPPCCLAVILLVLWEPWETFYTEVAIQSSHLNKHHFSVSNCWPWCNLF